MSEPDFCIEGEMLREPVAIIERDTGHVVRFCEADEKVDEAALPANHRLEYRLQPRVRIPAEVH
jgi:hypothetical protein